MPSTETAKARPRHSVRLTTLIACGYLIPLCLTLVAVGYVLQQVVTTRLWTSTEQRLTEAVLTTVGIRPGAQDFLNEHASAANEGVVTSVGSGLGTQNSQDKPASADNEAVAAAQEQGEEWLDHFGAFTPFTLVEALDDANQSARVIDMSGHILAQGGHNIEIMPLPPQAQFDRAKLLDPLQPHSTVSWLATDSNGNSVFCLLLPVSLTGFPDVFLQVVTYWRVAEDITRTLNNVLLWGGLGSLILSIVVTLLIAHHLSNPLERLAKTARLIEKGELGARTGISCRQREINDVAYAFDQMVDQLEKSFASQKRFVADASHELRTPLTAISGMAELMEDGDEEERQRYLGIMNREIERMGRLINDLLCLSRAENAKNTLADNEPVDLHKLLREVVASSQPANFSKEISLSAPVKALVKADSDSLARIFHNLIGNAQKYTPDNTPIEVSCRLHPTAVEVTVRDHGPGIPEADLPRIFERFFRSDASRNRKTGGSGLGLALVKALTESAGGEVSMRNHPEGGLEAIVRLPRHLAT